MKELYVSPEVEVTCFAPVEGIASDWEHSVSLTGDTGSSPVFEGSVPSNPGADGDLDP